MLAGRVRSRAPACAHCSSDLLRRLGFASADTFGFSLRSKVPFESYAFFGASPFASFVPSPVRDAIRVAILRRASFSLRSNFRPPCLACASRPVRRMALKSSHSARHGPQPACFLIQYRYLLRISFAFSGRSFHKTPRLRILCGTFSNLPCFA